MVFCDNLWESNRVVLIALLVLTKCHFLLLLYYKEEKWSQNRFPSGETLCSNL